MRFTALYCGVCGSLYEAYYGGEQASHPSCPACDGWLSEVPSWEPDSAPTRELGPGEFELVPVFGPHELRVWLDDDTVDRAAPQGWVQVATAAEAIQLLETESVVELSLDHDLGDDERFGRGIDVVDFLIEQQEVHDRRLWPRDGITLHTANPAGRDAMARAIRRYAGKTMAVEESLTPGGKPWFRFYPP